MKVLVAEAQSDKLHFLGILYVYVIFRCMTEHHE